MPSFSLRAARALIAAALPVALMGCAVTAPETRDALTPLKTVDRVEIARYVGTWHEIARYPFGIQDRNCARETTADYAVLDTTRISVVNRCLRADGGIFLAEGSARVVDPVSNAKLEVSFLPAWLNWLPVGRGDYWVLALAPDYSWVVIGEPRRRYLWILARTPTLPDATLNALISQLPALGYDPARVVASPGKRLPAR